MWVFRPANRHHQEKHSPSTSCRHPVESAECFDTAWRLAGALSRDYAGHNEFAGFSHGDPRLFLNAATAKARFNEGVPFFVETLFGRLRR